MAGSITILCSAISDTNPAYFKKRAHEMKITGLRSFMSRDGNRPRVLVALDTDEGITGWGECYNHGQTGLTASSGILVSATSGEDPRRIEALILKMMQQARFPPGALGLAAISAVDHALWDVSAKALNVPVYASLGGAVRDRVAVYQVFIQRQM